jgi:hypothetical protein
MKIAEDKRGFRLEKNFKDKTVFIRNLNSKDVIFETSLKDERGVEELKNRWNEIVNSRGGSNV